VYKFSYLLIYSGPRVKAGMHDSVTEKLKNCCKRKPYVFTPRQMTYIIRAIRRVNWLTVMCGYNTISML